MVNKRSLSGAFLNLLLSSTLLLAFYSTSPVHAATSWNVQTVHTRAAGQGNGYCPIVLDSNNVPSIAYTGYDSMMYARWNSSLGGFSTQKITIGIATDMALDTNNNPNILCEAFRADVKHASWSDASVMYASWTGSNWDIQTVNKNYTVYASLALDSAGNPHAAYSTGKALMYASRSGSNWTIEIVDNGTDIPIHLSLALDSNDKPYILYSNPDLKLATLENSIWKIQTIPLSHPIIGYGNMVLDSKGNPHLSYSAIGVGDPPTITIMYASWNGFGWNTETVVSNVDSESIASLALDSFDYPHICYVNGLKVMYAGWTGAEWSIQTVYTDLPACGPVYLAVDSNRIPHISFRANPPGEGLFSRINYMMYAVASEPVPLYSPLPLQLVLTAVAIGAAAVIVYLWRKE